DQSAIACLFDHGPDRPDVEHAVAHHAAVVERVLGFEQPVADMEAGDAALGALDGALERRVPPDVIDIETYAQHVVRNGRQPIADVELLMDRRKTGPVGGIDGM